MRERITSALDVLGLLLVAAGTTAGLLPLIGWAALGAGGVVILGAVRLADWLATRPERQPGPRRAPFSRMPTAWLRARSERAA